MAQVKISDLTALGATPGATDLIEVETGAGLPRKVTYAELVPLEDVTDLAALTAPATGDLFVIRDISDTTDGADGTDKKITALALTGYTAASASGAASVTLAEDTDNGVHTVTVQAPAAVTASVTTTLANATHDLGAVYVADHGRFANNTSSYDTDDVTGRQAGVRLPCDMTITAVYAGLRSLSGDDSNYRSFDVKYIPAAGAAAGGTSLCSAPTTQQATGGNAALPTDGQELFSLSVNQNLTRTQGDLIYFHFPVGAGTPTTLINTPYDIVVVGTRR